MTKIFILPQKREITKLAISRSEDPQPDREIHLLFPDEVTVPEDDQELTYDDMLTAEKIAGHIDLLAAGDKDIYLLYHLGNALSINEELLELLPYLTPKRYSHDSPEYEKILSLLLSIANDKITYEAEDLIKDFFFDRKEEAVLSLLHECITPQGAQAIAADERPHFLKDMRVAVTGEGREMTVRDFIREHLGTNPDCFSDAYIQDLHTLRKALLSSHKQVIRTTP